MSQYLIAVYNGPDTRSRPAEEMTEIVAAVDEVSPAPPLRLRVSRRSRRTLAHRCRGTAPQRVAADRGDAGKAFPGP